MPMENESNTTLLERIRLLEMRNRQLEQDLTATKIQLEQTQTKLDKIMKQIIILNLGNLFKL